MSKPKLPTERWTAWLLRTHSDYRQTKDVQGFQGRCVSNAKRRSEQEQRRLREASKCASCRALWDSFSDDFCQVHAEDAWHLAVDELDEVELVPLDPIQQDLNLSIAERDLALFLLQISLKYRDKQLMVTPQEEELIREEFRRRRRKFGSVPRESTGDQGVALDPLLLPALKDCSGLSFDFTHLSAPPSGFFAGYLFNSASFRNCAFTDVDFAGLDLSGADFSGSTLLGCRFDGASLHNAKFVETLIQESTFVKAWIEGGTFLRAVLRGSSLEDSHLVGADFSGADLRDANFRNAELDGAILVDAKMSAGQLDNRRAVTPEKAPKAISAFFRQHMNEDGSEKKGYESAEEAALAANRLGQAEGRKVNSYNCRICSKWHIGHKG